MAINLPIVSKFSDAGVKAAESSLKKFSQFAKQSAVAATAAIAGIATVSIREFGNFDSALQQSVSIMGEVSDALRNDMADAAREVAKTTTFSAEQAAESYYFLASAGLDATSSIAAMPAVAKFAQAGMFDMALATDLLTDAQSALGLSIKDDAVANMENMVKVSDVLARSSQLANATIEQFSTSLTTKAGTALKTVNKDIEEGAAALAVFADQGVKGELAGTQLTNTIFGLTDRAKAVPEQFEALGISVFDASGEMSNFADIADDFANALGGMTTQQKIATISQLGFTKQARAGLLLLMENGDALRNYEAELRNAQGTTDEVANKQLESFNAQMELLKSRLFDVAIEIGSQLAPRLLELMDRISPIIDQAAPVMLDLFDKIQAVLTRVYEEVSPLIEAALPSFLQLFEDLREPIGQVLEFLRILGETVLKAVIKLVTNASFLAALSSIGKSFGIIAEQIGIVLKSPIVQFLLDLTSAVIITGLNVLATALEVVANVFQRVIDVINAFNRTSIAPKSLPGGGMSSVSGFQINQGTQTYVPGMADGGIVLPTPGGTLAIIGEAGQSEAVIPLDRLDAMMGRGGGNISITVNAGMGTDGQDVGRKIVDEIISYERASGRVFARA